jgi:hypothetical protein
MDRRRYADPHTHLHRHAKPHADGNAQQNAPAYRLAHADPAGDTLANPQTDRNPYAA